MARGLIEVEVDGPQNDNFIFAPLGRRLRGRWVWSRVPNLHVMTISQRWRHSEFPGQRITLDIENGRGTITDPLVSDPAYAWVRGEIARQDLALGPDKEQFELSADHCATWCHWLRLGIDGGLLRVVSGTLPMDASKIGKVKLSFHSTYVPDKRDQLIEKLIGIIGSVLPSEKRKELAEALASE